MDFGAIDARPEAWDGRMQKPEAYELSGCPSSAIKLQKFKSTD